MSGAYLAVLLQPHVSKKWGGFLIAYQRQLSVNSWRVYGLNHKRILQVNRPTLHINRRILRVVRKLRTPGMAAPRNGGPKSCYYGIKHKTGQTPQHQFSTSVMFCMYYLLVWYSRLTNNTWKAGVAYQVTKWNFNAVIVENLFSWLQLARRKEAQMRWAIDINHSWISCPFTWVISQTPQPSPRPWFNSSIDAFWKKQNETK